MLTLFTFHETEKSKTQYGSMISKLAHTVNVTTAIQTLAFFAN